MRTQLIVIFVLLSAVDIEFGFSQDQDARNKKTFFEGGDSDIAGNDGDRAPKAIRKWTTPGSMQGDKLLTEEPFFWDYSVVGLPVFLRVIKNGNQSGNLEVWLESVDTKKFDLFKTYRVAYFSGKTGPKIKEGDNQAPEGFYFITPARMNSVSSYHLSMDMGYPNAYDRAHDRTGSLLMIHGSFVSVGCFAMTDCSIEQIYTLVHQAHKNGQKIVRVHCFPFPMTEENMQKHKDSRYIEFWKNLKEGWDWFEKNRRPPNVEVSDEKKYIFSE